MAAREFTEEELVKMNEDDLDIGWGDHMSDEEMDKRLKDNLEKVLLMGMRGEIKDE